MLAVDHQGGNTYRTEKVQPNKLNYKTRKTAGFCVRSNCESRAEAGRSQCKAHLRRMSKHSLQLRHERISKGLCTHCGLRPQFWGRRCIVCRQILTTDPLPRGARRALRLYREAETLRELEKVETETRRAALNLLESEKIKGKRAEALRLYIGLDGGKRRTYKEVAALMNLSLERIRQLLLPFKAALASTSGWRVAEIQRNGDIENEKQSTQGEATSCAHEECTVCQDRRIVYETCGLRNITLSGLVTSRCQICKSESTDIPLTSQLRKTIASAILCKPASLSGKEFQFLRKVAGFTPENLAQRLGVVGLTISAWEASSTLRLPNDIAARMYLASILFGESFCVDILKLFNKIRWAKAETLELRIRWHAAKRRWECLKATSSNDTKREDVITSGRIKRLQ